jgi:hypothetical protein
LDTITTRMRERTSIQDKRASFGNSLDFRL